MERRGVRLDVKALAQMSRELEARLNTLMQEIYALAGGEFNIASPPQLRTVLFDRLGLSRKGVRRGKTGLSTDVDVLTRLAAEHPLPAKILEYRTLAKLKSTYVDALPAAVDPRTGRLHTSFNQTVTATGRLSSSDPNLQNIPIRGDEGRRITRRSSCGSWRTCPEIRRWWPLSEPATTSTPARRPRSSASTRTPLRPPCAGQQRSSTSASSTGWVRNASPAS
jgi:hypothetical protein